MHDRNSGSTNVQTPLSGAASPLTPFRHVVFGLIWIATVVANVGGWMYNAAAGWLMTSLNTDPLMVSLVQVATSLPMFLFALPAGALADIINKRRFILILEIGVAIVSAAFAGICRQVLLPRFSFCSSCFS